MYYAIGASDDSREKPKQQWMNYWCSVGVCSADQSVSGSGEKKKGLEVLGNCEFTLRFFVTYAKRMIVFSTKAQRDACTRVAFEIKEKR